MVLDPFSLGNRLPEPRLSFLDISPSPFLLLNGRGGWGVRVE